MAEYYLWIKSFHIISAIAWMAGLLYLPRIYVYHANVDVGSEADKTFQTMERKLLRYIMNPAMIATLFFGLMLVHIEIEDLKEGYWFSVKVLFLLFLFASHGIMAKHRKNFEKGINKKSHTYFRVLNEVPTVAMIVIVIMVVVRPF